MTSLLKKARAFNPDLIVAAYFPQLFPPELLEIPRLGAVNVHPGDLPFSRGTFAIPWTILNGKNTLRSRCITSMQVSTLAILVGKRGFWSIRMKRASGYT